MTDVSKSQLALATVLDEGSPYYVAMHWPSVSQRPAWDKIEETLEFNGYEVVGFTPILGSLLYDHHTGVDGYSTRITPRDVGKTVQHLTNTLSIGYGATGVGVWPSATNYEIAIGEGELENQDEPSHFWRNLVLGMSAILLSAAALVLAVKK